MRAAEQTREPAPGGRAPGASFRPARRAPNRVLGRLCSGRPAIQRRLLVEGAADDVATLLALLGPPAGLRLALGDQHVEIEETIEGPPPSPALRRALQRIVGDAGRDSEISLVRDAPGVQGGAFPRPNDLTGGRRQELAVQHMALAEQQVPGFGVAMAIHELWENYAAHSFVPQADVDRYPASHAAALVVERLVGSELRPGSFGRLGQSQEETGGGDDRRFRVLHDYGDRFLEIAFSEHGEDDDNQIATAREARVRGRVTPRFLRIAGWGAGAVLPGGAAAQIALLREWLQDDRDQATAVITAFAGEGDAPGLAAARAQAVRAELGLDDRVGVQVSAATRPQGLVVIVAAEPA